MNDEDSRAYHSIAARARCHLAQTLASDLASTLAALKAFRGARRLCLRVERIERDLFAIGTAIRQATVRP